LFIYSRATLVESLPKRVVFHLVPSNPDSQAQSAARKDVEIRGLLCEQNGLPLRQDHDARCQAESLGKAG
jgi:hypothetical protein